MFKKANQPQEKVLGLLLMRFKVTPSQSVTIAQEWIDNHPEDSWSSLEQSLQNGLIRVQDSQLVSSYSPEIRKLVNDLRGENGIEIKDLNFRFKTYRKCFVGSDLIKWLINNYKTTKSEALKLGQDLIEEKIVHHVTDDHDFKDEYLFYRFYIDE